MTEKQFQAIVERLARQYGWLVYHTWMSFRSTAGFPDIIAAHPVKRKVLVAELKSDTGKLTPAQREWLDVLAACGVETHVWRPSQLQEIADILSAR